MTAEVFILAFGVFPYKRLSLQQVIQDEIPLTRACQNEYKTLLEARKQMLSAIMSISLFGTKDEYPV